MHRAPASYEPYNIVGIGRFRGKYVLSHKNEKAFYELYCAAMVGPHPGVVSLLERTSATEHAMLTVDVDHEAPGGRALVALYDIVDILTVVQRVQQYLRQHLDDVSDAHLHTAILQKDPYRARNGSIKHGFHLQFVNLYLSHADRATVLANAAPGLDHTASSPWLLYGSRKCSASGAYILTGVVVNATLMSVDEYCTTYPCQLRGVNSNAISRSEYITRMLSIRPISRCAVRFLRPMTTASSMPSTRPSVRPLLASAEFPSTLVRHKGKIDEAFGALTRTDFSCCGWKELGDGAYVMWLRRMIPCSCPYAPERVHDRRPAYVIVRADGTLTFYCTCLYKHA